MQKAGIELIVEGLMAFGRDMESANGSLKKLGSGGTLLQRTFEGIGGALSSFGREVLNVAEVALGVLLRDAINAVITKIKELIGAVFEAGSEFQLLELRLKRLNANWLIENENIKDYSQAMELATQATREQLKWLQQLAFTTPYDASDIANVFTLARSYGFAADEAKSLTESIINFASGMGLGNQEIERIIINFGQLVQQGKLNGQELRDLARGAFVPVNDILTRMRENMGLTTKEFEDMRKGGKLTGEAVQEFISAFQEIVAERFQGAAQDMARSWQGATANVIDFVKSILGLNVVKPILDTLGGALADLLSSISPEDFAFISEHADRFGQALAGLAGDLLDFGIDTDNLAENIAGAFDKMTTWIIDNKSDIIAFFEGIGETIRNRVVPFILKVVDGFKTIVAWVQENGPLIMEFFRTLGEIVAEVFGFDVSGFVTLEGILEVLKGFMQFVIENKEAIADWAQKLLTLFLIWQVGATVLNIIFGIIITVIGGILGLIGVVTAVTAVFALFGIGIAGVIALLSGFAIGLLIGIGVLLLLVGIAAVVFGAWLIMRNGGELFKAGMEIVVARIKVLWEELKKTAKETADRVRDAFLSHDWPSVGEAIVNGVISGVKQAGGALISLLSDLVKKALDAAKKALGIKSPSTEFELVGRMSIVGMAEGIIKNAHLAERAMRDAVASVTAPALAMPNIMQQYAVAASPSVNTSYQTTNNWNLTVHSQARTEQVVQDYNMMQSLGSA